MGSFAERFNSSRGDLVYLVRGTDNGRKAWHYVLVDKLKLPIFLKKIETGSLDLADYGAVLASGWGEDPPESVKKSISEQYS